VTTLCQTTIEHENINLEFFGALDLERGAGIKPTKEISRKGPIFNHLSNRHRNQKYKMLRELLRDFVAAR